MILLIILWSFRVSNGSSLHHLTWNQSTSQESHDRYEKTTYFLREKIPGFYDWYTKGKTCFKKTGMTIYDYMKSHQFYDADVLCNELENVGQNKGILMIGDSVQAHWVTQLAALFDASWSDFSVGDETNTGEWHENTPRWRICNGTQKVAFIRNDALTIAHYPLDGTLCNERHNTICRTWATAKILSTFSIIVLNTGAHYRTDENLMKEVSEAANYLKQYEKTHTIVYRNSVPGHANCETLTAPFHSNMEAEKWIADNPLYDYEKFKHQNILAWKLFRKVLPTSHLLDAYTSSVARGDQHQGEGDCLHVCVPSGPVMQWSIDLFNIIHFNNFNRE